MESIDFFVFRNESTVEKLKQIKKDYYFQVSIESISSFEELQRCYSKGALILIDADQIDNVEYPVVIKYLQSQQLQNRYILMKEHFTNDEMRFFLKNGAFDCLKKPLSEKCLYSTIIEFNRLKQQPSVLPDLQKEDHHYRSSIKVSLAYDLIFGNVKNAKRIWDQSRIAGLSVVPNIAMVVCIDDFHRLVKDKSNLWEQSIRNEIIESIKQYNFIKEMLSIIIGPEKIAVLLALPVQNDSLEYKQLALSHAQKIKQLIKQTAGYSVSIGIGSYYEDARNLHLSYQEGLHAQSYKLFLGKDSVIHIHDVETFNHETSFLPRDEIKIMASKLTMGDVEGVKEIWNEIIKGVSSQKNMNPKTFKFQILDILSILSRSAIDGGASPKDVVPIQLEYAKELLKTETIEQISQWIEEVVDCYLEQVLTNHNEQMLKSIQKALTYINLHYTEDISLEKVAQHVYLSANYFSTVFKETTGLSFIEYLTHLRIDKAKSLLMDLDYTIYKIAEDVGYSTPRYFSRVFKSITGMTPSQFRNSVLITKRG
ncbi:helix-turn-helix domain-containing protein [Peribacillus sp. NPDC094092]|uniref:helix-turn-helix domain-containing protein n=1 Tax=Peribacillus sp. NPDC094092 TaxID=3390611 RepID=UPI003D06DE7F